MSAPELTVVLPCLNEIRTLPQCIEKIHKACKEANIDYEILVSDNGSTDGSQEKAKELGARVSHATQRGYGAALKNGFDNAYGKYVIFADADDTYNFLEIPRFWEEVKKGNEVVIGTRIKGTIKPGAMPFLHRFLGTPVLTALIRNLYNIKITDCNSGMRLLNREIYKKLGMQSNGMEFASEMLVKLGLNQVSVKEIPITLWPDMRGREPHLRTWRDGWRHLRFIVMYGPKKLLITPGIILFWLGLLGVVSLTAGPLEIGGRVFDYHTQIAFATLGLIGFTAASFGQLIAFFSHISSYVKVKRTSLSYFSLSFEKKLLWSLFLFLIGAGLGGYVIFNWAQQGYRDISEVHKFVGSMFFITSSVVSSLLALTMFTFGYEKTE